MHRATRHAAVLDGVEAFTLLTDRAFPRHAQDGFGFGLIDSGAHRSWSGLGAPGRFDRGIADLARAAGPEGTFINTFFKATARTPRA